MSFTSTLYLGPVLDMLLQDVPPLWRMDLRLGLQEALVNAVKHGNCLDPSKIVLIHYTPLPGSYRWVIQDQGTGFVPVPDLVCGRETCLRDAAESGRGLYILDQIFDHVEWADQGRQLTLIKHQHRPAATWTPWR
ncbi:MAG: ATP-binding protein [Gloeomargaritaceae cyanobacterium C42_A2020_066]|nr:ATP-binding protein [Gloeomargaritaceae cyanobacterium C42_A2020_066]